MAKTPEASTSTQEERKNQQAMKKYLFVSDEHLFSQIEDVANLKNMTVADYLLESAAMNIRYFSKVERPRYEHISSLENDMNEQLEFYSNAFSC